MYSIAGHQYYDESDANDSSKYREIVDRAIQENILMNITTDEFLDITDGYGAGRSTLFSMLCKSINVRQVIKLSKIHEDHWMYLLSSLGFNPQIVRIFYRDDLGIALTTALSSIKENQPSNVNEYINALLDTKYLIVSRKSSMPQCVRSFDDRVCGIIKKYYGNSIITDDTLCIHYAPSLNMQPIYCMTKLLHNMF